MAAWREGMDSVQPNNERVCVWRFSFSSRVSCKRGGRSVVEQSKQREIASSYVTVGENLLASRDESWMICMEG